MNAHSEKGSHQLRLHRKARLSMGLTKDEGDLDLGQVEEVLGDVDGDLVQEGRGDVEAILNVVQVAARLPGAKSLL